MILLARLSQFHNSEGCQLGQPAEAAREMARRLLRMMVAFCYFVNMLPDALIQTIRGFQPSRVLLTAIELNLFTAVGDGATAGEVAARLKTDPRATEMLLNAVVALEMLTKQDGIFRNTATAARLMAESSPEDERLAWMHTVNMWDSWSTLTDCVKAGTAVGSKVTPERDSSWTEAFIAAMDRNAGDRAPLLAKSVGAKGVRRMLDVGGGSAAYSIAFAKAAPELNAEILDQSEVLPIAQRHIDKAGLTSRIKTRAGDLRADRLGSGYDLVLLSAICHMLGPQENRDLLSRCHEALAPQGRLVIQDFILESDKTGPAVGALFALNMLVATPNGNSYSYQEYADWMREAGFGHIHRESLPGPTDIVIGTRSPE